MPTASETAWIGVESPAAAVALLGHMRERMGDTVSAFELVRRSLIDFDSKQGKVIVSRLLHALSGDGLRRSPQHG